MNNDDAFLTRATFILEKILTPPLKENVYLTERRYSIFRNESTAALKVSMNYLYQQTMNMLKGSFLERSIIMLKEKHQHH